MSQQQPDPQERLEVDVVTALVQKTASAMPKHR